MYCIGITGTIASGKSSVCALFAKQNINVISADHISRALTLPDQPAFTAIIQHFGTHLLSPDGTLNRRLLREIIFNDEAERKWLEHLLHPLIRKHIMEEIPKCQSPYCLIEIPLLTNRTDYAYLNRILAVIAPATQRIQRLMTRDHCTQQHAMSILSAQIDDVRYQQLADDVIINDGSREHLEARVFKLQKEYMEKASRAIKKNNDGHQ